MDKQLPLNIVDDDLPFESDLAALFQQSMLPRRLEIDQLVDGRESLPRIRDAVQDARPRRLRGWLAAATLVVCAGFLIGLSGIFFPPKSALAQVAAQLQRASSLRCSVTTTGFNGAKHGILYWAAPGSYREEQTIKGQVVSVDIQPANQPGIHIFHSPVKTFRKLPVDHGQALPIMILEKLATLRGKADRDLERSMIGDLEAPGFEIAFQQLNAKAGAADKLRVWYNPKTMRPLRIEAELFSLLGIVRIGDFVWDEPSDKWFDTTPPAGYEERKLELPPTAETVDALVKAFRIYAKYCGDRYPQGNTIQTEFVNAELYFKTGMAWSKLNPPEKGRVAPNKRGRREFPENVKDYWSAQRGFSEINLLRQFPVDLAYHGKTVGPNDREKVLLRWKLESGNYQVIYGDLHSELASTQRLKELESR